MNQDEIRPALFAAVCALFKAHAKIEALADAYREAGNPAAAALATIELDRIADAINRLREMDRD